MVLNAAPKQPSPRRLGKRACAFLRSKHSDRVRVARIDFQVMTTFEEVGLVSGTVSGYGNIKTLTPWSRFKFTSPLRQRYLKMAVGEAAAAAASGHADTPFLSAVESV